MGEVILVRHGQASFGAADYDQLSALGRVQSEALGRALSALGVVPDAWFRGGLKRHRQTFDGLARSYPGAAPAVHEGLNEFEGGELIRAHAGLSADGFRAMLGDRKAFFRALNAAVLAWQRDEIADPPEAFAAFNARVEAARAALFRPRGRVVAVTSGGPIALLVVQTLGAPLSAMPALQLQLKNASITRLRFGASGAHLSSFNEVPHIADADAAHLESFS